TDELRIRALTHQHSPGDFDGRRVVADRHLDVVAAVRRVVWDSHVQGHPRDDGPAVGPNPHPLLRRVDDPAIWSGHGHITGERVGIDYLEGDLEPFRRAGLDQRAWRIETDPTDRKSTRLNSSHVKNSYAVFCLKKKKIYLFTQTTANEEPTLPKREP